MSQEQEVSEFEEEMNEQVAAQAEPEKVETKEAEPEETKTEEVKEEKPEESTTDSKKDEWTLTAVMDEREKRQKAVKEAEELREKLKAFEKPEDDVSIFEDEAAWKAAQEEKVQQDLRNASLNMSQAFAEETFGEDKVAKAAKWMQEEGQKSPYVVQQFNEAKLPFHKLVKLYDAEQERLNPESLREKLKQELLEELQAEKEPEKKPEKSIAPSLASKRSAGEPSRFPDNPEDILGE